MNYKVLLIGDSCEDEYIYGKCETISSESPVPVMKFSKIKTKPGMSANVFLNLQSFGIDVTFLTNSEKIIRTRFVDEKTNHQVFRIDNEEKIKPLLLPIFLENFDAVVISDHDKGYLSESKLFEIVNQSSCPVFIESKKTYLPNKENCFIKVDEEDCEKLNHGCQLDNLIIMRNLDGCIFKDTLYPTEKIKVYDLVGVGDAFLASLTYGYLKYQNIDDALMFGNRASMIVAQHPGGYILTEEDINSIC
jgi:D-beta-D-heptose 7-phosphate kinase/D-beta-D-heptose 1-phosphate adenosyltransferase